MLKNSLLLAGVLAGFMPVLFAQSGGAKTRVAVVGLDHESNPVSHLVYCVRHDKPIEDPLAAELNVGRGGNPKRGEGIDPLR